MIRILKGKIEYLEFDYIILNVNGIGFQIFMPLPYIKNLHNNNNITIFTYMLIREDKMKLYGFLNKEDLELFELLITVNGIGPKGAINILSIIPSNELKYSISIGDSTTISKANGIGKKTAEKCIVELKDKISTNNCDISFIKKQNNILNLNDKNINEAIEVLTTLGYNIKEVKIAINQINYDNIKSSEDIIKKALILLNKF